jgi:TRAP-type uncharacterized transport system substrate-binding protein
MTSRAPAFLFVVVAVVLVALPALGFDPREFARRHGGTTRLSIATGNTGGVYYPYGGAIARIISQSLPAWMLRRSYGGICRQPEADSAGQG